MAKKENGFDWHSHAFASSTSIIRVGREVLRSLRIAFMDTWIASINSKMEVGSPLLSSLPLGQHGLWSSAQALFAVRRFYPRLNAKDQGLILWFILTGSIHIFFEGYFVYNHHARMASRTDLFGQLWKEYALSDSRYMSSDSFLLTIEAWTVILWGPLSYLTAVFITTNSQFRHTVQALVSTGELYGNLLYLVTSLLDEYTTGRRYYRPEPLYFWVYFVLMNSQYGSSFPDLRSTTASSLRPDLLKSPIHPSEGNAREKSRTMPAKRRRSTAKCPPPKNPIRDREEAGRRRNTWMTFRIERHEPTISTLQVSRARPKSSAAHDDASSRDIWTEVCRTTMA
ncbi:hypothetical protein EYC84_011483 [Monilinia fructicola]|uniref:EXPERA domain-containing protein n=1 Tax=Monilinia fructicola TaxID=38448 RepID=A0A5M9J8F6_MONFR|nr:hypothetical protein EYC84_011483 [Monilinia fructicola]